MRVFAVSVLSILLIVASGNAAPTKHAKRGLLGDRGWSSSEEIGSEGVGGGHADDLATNHLQRISSFSSYPSSTYGVVPSVASRATFDAASESALSLNVPSSKHVSIPSADLHSSSYGVPIAAPISTYTAEASKYDLEGLSSGSVSSYGVPASLSKSSYSLRDSASLSSHGVPASASFGTYHGYGSASEVAPAPVVEPSQEKSWEYEAPVKAAPVHDVESVSLPETKSLSYDFGSNHGVALPETQSLSYNFQPSHEVSLPETKSLSFDFESRYGASLPGTKSLSFDLGSSYGASLPETKTLSYDFGSSHGVSLPETKLSFDLGSSHEASLSETKSLSYDFGSSQGVSLPVTKSTFDFGSSQGVALPATKSTFDLGSSQEVSLTETKSSFDLGSGHGVSLPETKSLSFDFGSRYGASLPAGDERSLSLPKGNVEVVPSVEIPLSSIGLPKSLYDVVSKGVSAGESSGDLSLNSLATSVGYSQGSEKLQLDSYEASDVDVHGDHAKGLSVSNAPAGVSIGDARAEEDDGYAYPVPSKSFSF